MSEAKFTKGEWLIKPLEDDKDYIRIRGSVLGGRFKIANVIDTLGAQFERERTETIANAHLIKTSPDMFIFIENLILDGVLSQENGEIAAKLLAKARGEV